MTSKYTYDVNNYAMTSKITSLRRIALTSAVDLLNIFAFNIEDFTDYALDDKRQ